MLQFVTFPVKLGFLNGLSLVIGKAQLESFMIPPKEIAARNLPKSEHFHIFDFNVATSNYVKADKFVVMLILTFICLGINFLPERFQQYPLALISIIIVSGLEHGLVRPLWDKDGTTLVEDMADLKADFLKPAFDEYDMPSLGDAFPKVPVVVTTGVTYRGNHSSHVRYYSYWPHPKVRTRFAWPRTTFSSFVA